MFKLLHLDIHEIFKTQQARYIPTHSQLAIYIYDRKKKFYCTHVTKIAQTVIMILVKLVF